MRQLRKLGWGQGGDHVSVAAAMKSEDAARRATGKKVRSTKSTGSSKSEQKMLFGGKGKNRNNARIEK